jgi:hypothetical protein
MKSKTLFHGKRAEVAPNYFVLMHGGKTIFIPYKNVASIKVGKTFWQKVGTVAMWPVEGAMYAVIIPVGVCVLAVSTWIDEIRGKDPWN